jgi:hypothetical protein
MNPVYPPPCMWDILSIILNTTFWNFFCKLHLKHLYIMYKIKQFILLYLFINSKYSQITPHQFINITLIWYTYQRPLPGYYHLQVSCPNVSVTLWSSVTTFLVHTRLFSTRRCLKKCCTKSVVTVCACHTKALKVLWSSFSRASPSISIHIFEKRKRSWKWSP